LFKVLFVCSGNKGISPIVKAQADSLTNNGITIDFYLIKGNGILGYWRNIYILKQYLKENRFDIIHAHYSLSAIVATFAREKPLITSLMGSDVIKGTFKLWLIRLLVKKRWKATIVKTNEMAEKLGIKNIMVIPNGVDMDMFIPLNMKVAKHALNLNNQLNYILFLGDQDRYEKNFNLTKKALRFLNMNNLELIYLQNIPHERIPYYINSAQVGVLSSLWEGSPNIIKEAMACNCPIVTTDVGDVKWIIGDTEGCYISSFDPEDMAEKIRLALEFGKRTNGRQRLLKLGLDSETIAKRLIELYKQVL